MKMRSMIIKLVVGLLLVALLGGCVQQGDKDKKTINTKGQAILKILPDEASVRVVIETLKPTAEASKNKNAEITDKVYAALYKINIPREGIQTEYFNIFEDIEWTENGSKSNGFKTQNTLKIKTTEFKELGKIIDAVVNAGATRIEGIDFDLSDAKKKDLKKQALGEASKDAREKAEAIADGIGAKIVGIISISDVNYDYNPYPVFARPMMADEAVKQVANTEISPQKLEVAANIEVTFEIK